MTLGHLQGKKPQGSQALYRYLKASLVTDTITIIKKRVTCLCLSLGVLEGICISGKTFSPFDFKTQFASGASENWTVAIIVAGHNNNYDHCIAEPSDYPRIDENRTSTVTQGQHREVHLTWTVSIQLKMFI